MNKDQRKAIPRNSPGSFRNDTELVEKKRMGWGRFAAMIAASTAIMIPTRVRDMADSIIRAHIVRLK